MLKMKIDGAKTIEIVVAGTIPDICAELLFGVKTMKEKMDNSTGMGDAFIATLKHGLDFIDDMDDMDEDDVDDMVNKLVDKALEDDDFLDEMMDMLPDELKADFARRLKKRVKKASEERKSSEEAVEEEKK